MVMISLQRKGTSLLVMAIISALILPASAALVIMHFMWKNRLKKKYYNGTNPFILR